ncbi:hypothetical protein V1478_003847, partial [Vespula squamosa]
TIDINCGNYVVARYDRRNSRMTRIEKQTGQCTQDGSERLFVANGRRVTSSTCFRIQRVSRTTVHRQRVSISTIKDN